MILYLTALASLAAQDVPQLSLEQRMLVRCSAAFALAAHSQAEGDPEMARYPDLSERGREFFVRVSARLMDETGMDREALAATMAREANSIVSENTLGDIMPVCLPLLPPE